MSKIFNSRGFIMSVVGSIFILVAGFFLDKSISVTAMQFIGVLFGAKVLGSEVKKSIRTSKGITYDENLECEVYVEGHQKKR